MANKKNIEIDVERIHQSREIIESLVELRPYRSFSFVLNDEGFAAIEETISLAEWGIGRNKSRIKEAALRVLNRLVAHPSGTPLNVNLTKKESESMDEVLWQIDRALEQHKEGLLTR
jgi:hypothetical protein